MTHTKEEYQSFNRYLDGQIRKGKLRFDMTDYQLNEALFQLGIRRKKEGKSVIYVYPHKNQTNYVKDYLQHKQPVQERIGFERPYSYDKNGRLRVNKGKVINFQGKFYKGGRLLPKRYLSEE